VLLLLTVGGVTTGFYVVRASDRKSVADVSQIIHAERHTIANMVNATGTVRLRSTSRLAPLCGPER
jgi:hypothetical protein